MTDSFDLSAYESVLIESEQQPSEQQPSEQQPSEQYSSLLTEGVQEASITESIVATEETKSTSEQAEELGKDELMNSTSLDMTADFDVDAIIAAESVTSLSADFDVDAIIAAEAEGLENMTF